MRATAICLSVLVLIAAIASALSTVDAALTSAQKKQLGSINRDLRKVPSLIRRKKFGEAEKKLQAAQAEVEKLSKGNEQVLTIIRAKRLIELQRNSLGRAKGGKPGKPAKGTSSQVSFSKQIAPILKNRCGKCHVSRASGRLRFDTFANLVKGGSGGRSFIPKRPLDSLLYRRLNAQGNQRMPKGAAALPASEIQLIRKWIAQGAIFDGKARSGPIGQAAAGIPLPPGDPAIPKPTGNETVSFVKDVAPFIVNLCTRCHGGNNPRAGLSVVTFESLMKGSDNGRVLLPGNLDGSMLWQRVGTPQPRDKRMPQGRGRITRTNHSKLRQWIAEGCKFDGSDPKAPLRRLIPTAEQLKTEQLAKLSPAEFENFRLKRSNEHWDRTFSKEKPQYIEGKEVLVYGNVGAARMQVIYGWAEDHVKRLRSSFRAKGDRVWKGRLTIFVIKDRFGYEEFNVTVNGRQQIPPEMVGHSVVTTGMEDAYVVLQDVGDDVTGSNPGMKFNVIDHVTGAFLKRSGRNLPDWVVRGTGVFMAAKQDADNPHVKQMRVRVPDMLASLSNHNDLFNNGTFSPSDVGVVGYALVGYMTKTGGIGRFGKFVNALQKGDNVGTAMKSVYLADTKAVAIAFVRRYKK